MVKQARNYKLTDIINVKIIKSGIKNSTTDTLEFTVSIILSNDLEVNLDSNSSHITAVVQARYIKAFLGLCDNSNNSIIDTIDLSGV